MDQQKKLAVVCLSGGMDSTGLLMHMLAQGYTVFGISFDYGQRHKLELERLSNNLEYLRSHGMEVSHHVVDLSILGRLYHSALTDTSWKMPEGFYEQDNMKETVVPNRNAIFSSIAYGYALSISNKLSAPVVVALGVHSGDHAIYPDCRPEFYRAIHHAFSIGNWDSEKISLYLPYLEGNKLSILRESQRSIEKLGLDFETIFRNTCTSYEPNSEGLSSGRTGADVERILAFHQLGIPDPIKYVRSWEEVVADALEMERNANSADR